MDAIKKYLSDIGRKGGLASSKHPRRSELNREAAQARWSRVRAQKEALENEARKLARQDADRARLEHYESHDTARSTIQD